MHYRTERLLIRAEIPDDEEVAGRGIRRGEQELDLFVREPA